MDVDKDWWKQGLYENARDAGHDYMSEHPNSGYTELQAYCYNYLIETEEAMKNHQGLCEKISHKAAKRAHNFERN